MAQPTRRQAIMEATRSESHELRGISTQNTVRCSNENLAGTGCVNVLLYQGEGL